MAEKRVRAFLIIVAASVLLTGVGALLVHPFNPDKHCCDHLFYRSMSYNLFTVSRPDLNAPPPGSLPDLRQGLSWLHLGNGFSRQPPFVYRVATPLLARAVAYVTGINVAYYLVSFLALAAAALFIGLSIFELTGSEVPAVAGVILFIVNPFSANFNLFDYMLTDPMAFFLAALAIWALVKRKRFLFFAACAVGVLNKESMVPMVIAYPLTEAWVDHHLRGSSVAAAAGIIVGYYLFRVVMPEVPGYSIFNQFHAGFHHIEAIAGAVFIVFGVVVPAALRRPWGSRLMVALVPFAVACVLEAWFVGDLERAIVQALPAVCVGIFWLWPADLRRQLLTMAVVPLAFIQSIIVVQGGPQLARYQGGSELARYGGSVMLFLVAVAAEIWLWHFDRGSRVARYSPEPFLPLGAVK